MENLLIDGFFLDLVKSPSLPVDEHEIVLHKDGTWNPLSAKKDNLANLPNKSRKLNTTNIMNSKLVNTIQTAFKRPHSDSVDCITLDDTEHNVPPTKRRKMATPTYLQFK